MTKNEEKEIIRVCGENYEYEDIPTFIRNRDEKEEFEMEQELADISKENDEQRILDSLETGRKEGRRIINEIIGTIQKKIGHI